MSDIAPELLELVREQYNTGLNSSTLLSEVLTAIADHKATYEDANNAAKEVGNILSESYKNITSDTLPDGRMYYNIADRVVGTTMTDAYEYIADIAEQTQAILNENAGIGIKAIVPDINEDRIAGIVNRLSEAANFEDIRWLLDAPIKNFCQSIIDDSVKSNAEFQSNTGLSPKIVRKAASGCCEWCTNLAGTYSYPNNVPDDVYRRHENCNCTVEYDPGSGKRQNIHTKQWTDSTDTATLETRKIIGLNVNRTTINGVSQTALRQITENNLTSEAVKDAILNPLQVGAVQYDETGSPFFSIVGSRATITINPETGYVITAKGS